MMYTPASIRAQFIELAAPFLDDYVKSAFTDIEFEGSGLARANVWTLLADIIRQAGDKVTLNIEGAAAADQIDDVLKKVSSGEITPEQGKEYMALIQSGFDMTEFPKLIDVLESAKAGR